MCNGRNGTMGRYDYSTGRYYDLRLRDPTTRLTVLRDAAENPVYVTNHGWPPWVWAERDLAPPCDARRAQATTIERRSSRRAGSL